MKVHLFAMTTLALGLAGVAACSRAAESDPSTTDFPDAIATTTVVDDGLETRLLAPDETTLLAVLRVRGAAADWQDDRGEVRTLVAVPQGQLTTSGIGKTIQSNETAVADLPSDASSANELVYSLYRGITNVRTHLSQQAEGGPVPYETCGTNNGVTCCYGPVGCGCCTTWCCSDGTTDSCGSSCIPACACAEE